MTPPGCGRRCSAWVAPHTFRSHSRAMRCWPPSRALPNHREGAGHEQANRRLAIAAALCGAGLAVGQGMIMDMAVNKVVQKYQGASCEQLWQQRGQAKSMEEQRVVEFLKNDAQARTEFLNRVAGPVAN